jgi:hypothetical protein
VSLVGCSFSDAGLKPLAGLGRLPGLQLAGTQVTAGTFPYGCAFGTILTVASSGTSFPMANIEQVPHGR